MSDRYHEEFMNDFYDEPDALSNFHDDENGFPIWEDDDDEDWYGEVDDSMGICSPARCGSCWAGDGLCMQEIEAQAQLSEEFARFYVKENIPCPHCGKVLMLYRIPTTELWVWPVEWPGGAYYPPYIALDIFAVMDAGKGEIHEPFEMFGYVIHHIWVGEGEFMEEKLIVLDKGVENDSSVDDQEV